MLIGLTGAAGAGKDTCAHLLRQIGWRSVAFADALRAEIAAGYGIDGTLLGLAGPAKEMATPVLSIGMALNRDWLRFAAARGLHFFDWRSPRWVMQTWGEWRREQNPGYWLERVADWVRRERALDLDASLVVTDVRHANELALLNNLQGRLVRVHRPGLPGLPPDTAHHASEQHRLLPAEMDIHNDGNLHHLANEVLRVVGGLLSPRQQEQAHQPTTMPADPAGAPQ